MKIDVKFIFFRVRTMPCVLNSYLEIFGKMSQLRWRKFAKFL